MKGTLGWLRWLIAIALASMCLAPAPAGAEQAPQLEAIRARMETGLSLFVGGDVQEAARQFEAGYLEYPYPAFLFNAGVCYEKLGRDEDALAKYKQYLLEDPKAPDADAVARRIDALQQRAAAPELAAPVNSELGTEQMRSLVVLETDPPGAQAHIFRPKHARPAPFRREGANPDWEEIVTATTPANLSLSVGEYHVAIDRFAGFNASDTPLTVSAGHVHHFKANLSQGVFMAFLRVSSNVRGARIWLDERRGAGREWGTAPYAELVPVGKHTVFVEAPGFEPAHKSLSLSNGERRNVHVELVRVGYGFVAVEAGDAVEARVSLNGRFVGVWRKGQPPLAVRAPAGAHTLSVEAPGRKDFEGQVEVPRGQVLPVKLRLIPTYPRGTAWAQAAVSAALLGTGVVLGLESENIAERVETERAAGSLQSDDPRLVRGKWFAIGADVSFAAGALMAGLATWNFIRDPLPESSLAKRPLREFEPVARTGDGGLRVMAGGTPRAFAVQLGGTF